MTTLPLMHRLLPRRDDATNNNSGHYWNLLHRLGLSGSQASRTLKAVGLTGCQRGEGVSTIAVSLAVTAAAAGQGAVLLMDANLERPAIHRLLGVKPGPGLAEALAECVPSPAVQPSLRGDLHVLAAGDAAKCPPSSLAVSAFAHLLQSLQKSFALIVVDMPPADQGGMTAEMAGCLDGVLLVVEADRVRGDEVRRCKDLLSRVPARLLGAIFNKQRQYLPTCLSSLM